MTNLPNLNCPQCGAPLSMDDVNVSTDMVLCRACARTSRYSEVAQQMRDEETWQTVPESLQVQKTMKGVEVTWRKSPMLAMVVLSIVAAGCVTTIFLCLELMGNWLLPMIVAMELVVFLVMACVMLGRVTLTLEPGSGEVFRGLGCFGLRKRFRLGEDTTIACEERVGPNHVVTHVIVVKPSSGRGVAFGGSMPDDGRQYMMTALRRMRR